MHYSLYLKAAFKIDDMSVAVAGDRLQKLIALDHLQFVKSQTVTRCGNELAIRCMGRCGKQCAITLKADWVVCRVDLQLVHPLLVEEN